MELTYLNTEVSRRVGISIVGAIPLPFNGAIVEVFLPCLITIAIVFGGVIFRLNSEGNTLCWWWLRHIFSYSCVCEASIPGHLRKWAGRLQWCLPC